MKEFNLSEKYLYMLFETRRVKVYPEEFVKKFIKELKEELKNWGSIEKAMEGKTMNQIVNELAGNELI